jgi:hypothetical protein
MVRCVGCGMTTDAQLRLIAILCLVIFWTVV